MVEEWPAGTFLRWRRLAVPEQNGELFPRFVDFCSLLFICLISWVFQGEGSCDGV